MDSELKRQTIGLVQLQDFQRIRSELEDKKRDKSHQLVKEKKKKRKEKSTLSFDVDDMGEEVIIQGIKIEQ